MSRSIVVINPNSSTSVTASIDAALAPLRLTNGLNIECHTLTDAPSGIQSEADIMQVMPLLSAFINAHKEQTAGFVIACFSDPGLAMAREATRLPVYGIGESAMLTALTQGQSVGVVAIQPTSISRHLRAWGAMGILSRLAGERALGLNVGELINEKKTWMRLLETGQKLRDEDGANVVVLGCAGLAHHRLQLEQELGLPVVEPCTAAAGMALTAAHLAASGK
ncbi:aspartate/glutamate racemase family protein [Vreelandella olivaria]|uniref:aspartate/glutamate racemase family protein n=1 Tax=Vreelandella olivaria TaxID=390919 RepID=UPI00201EEFBA|nr:aspartate/glutamate racemase family protein [Halomonas olivaria]